jgi:hypothetical protein
VPAAVARFRPASARSCSAALTPSVPAFVASSWTSASAAVWNCAAALHSSGEYVGAAGAVVTAGGAGGVAGGAAGCEEHPATTTAPSTPAAAARSAARPTCPVGPTLPADVRHGRLLRHRLPPLSHAARPQPTVEVLVLPERVRSPPEGGHGLDRAVYHHRPTRPAKITTGRDRPSASFARGAGGIGAVAGEQPLIPCSGVSRRHGAITCRRYSGPRTSTPRVLGSGLSYEPARGRRSPRRLAERDGQGPWRMISGHGFAVAEIPVRLRASGRRGARSRRTGRVQSGCRTAPDFSLSLT